MGLPAQPTPADRAATRAYSASVVRSVEYEVEMPQAVYADGDAKPDEVTIFDLSHEIQLLRADLAEVCELAGSAAMRIPNWEKRKTVLERIAELRKSTEAT